MRLGIQVQRDQGAVGETGLAAGHFPFLALPALTSLTTLLGEYVAFSPVDVPLQAINCAYPVHQTVSSFSSESA